MILDIHRSGTFGLRNISHRNDNPLGRFLNSTVHGRSLARYLDVITTDGTRQIHGEPGWGWWYAFGKRTLRGDDRGFIRVINHGDVESAEQYREALEYECYLACYDDERN